MPRTTPAERRDRAAEAAIKDVGRVLGITEPNGGYRIALKALLLAFWDMASSDSAWDEPETLSEVTGRPNQPARGRTPFGGPIGSEPGDTDSWSELRGWWEQTAHDEIAGLLAKMQEYGGAKRATDLVDVGQAMVAAGVAVPTHRGDTSPGAQELGIYFYLVGKFGRWRAAIAEGRPVSDDTLHDIAIYTRMVQRIRAVGGWPV